MAEGAPRPDPAGTTGAAPTVASPPVPRPPRRAAFDAVILRRLAAEFVVIVVGVLVAFAVDDWQAGVERREAALRLIGAMESDITASVEDLREAAASAAVRRDAMVELLRLAGQPLPPGEWTPWDEVDFSGLRGAVAQRVRDLGPEALRAFPIIVQVFDPRTASFDELRSTGGLATIPDPAVQRAIVEYFGAMLDFAESNQMTRADQFALQDAWQRAGIIAFDWLPMDEFLARLRASPEALAAVRRSFFRALDQADGYVLLADRLEAEGLQIVADARAALGD